MFLHFSLCRQQFFTGFNFMYSSLVFILYLIKQIYFQVPSRLITQCYKHFSGIDSGYFQIFGLSVVLHYSMLFSYWIFSNFWIICCFSLPVCHFTNTYFQICGLSVSFAICVLNL
jgi:hypothetical protein